jgi:preprotein translocase subunit SecG
MIPVFISIGTFLLIIVALALIMVVLAQRAKSDSGMAAMGGGMMESAFGPDTSNVLSKFTIRATIVFFVLSFMLYLGYVRVRSHGSGGKGSLPNIASPAALPSIPAGNPAPSAAQPAMPAVSIPTAAPAPAAPKPAATTAAPDAANTTTQSGAASKAP